MLLSRAQEAWFSPAMRHIAAVHAVAAEVARGAREEARVGAGEHLERAGGEARGLCPCAAGTTDRPLDRAHLDVLGAVAEALLHVDDETAGACLAHRSVGAISPPRLELKSEEPDRRAGDEPTRDGISGDGPRVDRERARIRGVDESGHPGEHRREGPALGIEGPDDEVREHLE